MSTTEVNVGQLRIRYLVDGSQSESLGMFELTVPPGSNVPPPHSHTHNEKIVFVLEGTLRYTVGAETQDLTPGQTMRTPKGSAHGFANPLPASLVHSSLWHPISGQSTFKTSPPWSMRAALQIRLHWLPS